MRTTSHCRQCASYSQPFTVVVLAASQHDPQSEYKEILDFKETSREDPGTEFENLAASDYGMS